MPKGSAVREDIHNARPFTYTIPGLRVFTKSPAQGHALQISPIQKTVASWDICRMAYTQDARNKRTAAELVKCPRREPQLQVLAILFEPINTYHKKRQVTVLFSCYSYSSDNRSMIQPNNAHESYRVATTSFLVIPDTFENRWIALTKISTHTCDHI